jgi:hypothetical protein
MRTGNRTALSFRRWRRLPPALAAVVVALFVATTATLPGADRPAVDPREYLAELRRLGARKPFLTDSPDVYLEPQSLGQFFTEKIYRELRGNAYFGYDYDEGFVLEGKRVQIEVLKELTPGTSCQAAYRMALEQALNAAGLQLKLAAPIQIGVCIVGVESRETQKTLAGVMVEAYLRNATQKKSFFIRYGSGHTRSLAAAVRLSAEILVSQLVSLTNASRRGRSN